MWDKIFFATEIAEFAEKIKEKISEFSVCSVAKILPGPANWPTANLLDPHNFISRLGYNFLCNEN